MCHPAEQTILLSLFLEFKPINPDDARLFRPRKPGDTTLVPREDIREVSIDSEEYRSLLKLAKKRDQRILDIKKRARERLALCRPPTNPVKDFVKTTHDRELSLDLHKHFSDPERVYLAKLTEYVVSAALKCKLAVVFDTFKETCYNKQYWIVDTEKEFRPRWFRES